MKTLQDKIFDSILSRFEKKSDAVANLSELLSVGKDAIYRRLRGDTIITPEEIGILSEEFKLSLDGLIHNQSNLVFFSFKPFENTLKNFDDYLDSAIKDTEIVASRQDSVLYYASSEIPIFLIGLVPEVVSFHLYLWGKNAFGFDYLNDLKFSFDLIPPSTKEKYKTLIDLYMKVPSVELWGSNLIDNLLKQIEYHSVSDKFANPDDALVLLKKLSIMFKHIKEMARHGKKFHPGSEPNSASHPYELYHNELLYIKNTVIGITPSGVGVFSSFGNPNYLKSYDARVTDYIVNWFEKVKLKSTPLSAAGIPNLDLVFNRIQKKIEKMESKIRLHLDGDLDDL